MSVSSTNKITSVMIQYQKYFTVKADIPYIFNDKTVFNWAKQHCTMFYNLTENCLFSTPKTKIINEQYSHWVTSIKRSALVLRWNSGNPICMHFWSDNKSSVFS